MTSFLDSPLLGLPKTPQRNERNRWQNISTSNILILLYELLVWWSKNKCVQKQSLPGEDEDVSIFCGRFAEDVVGRGHVEEVSILDPQVGGRSLRQTLQHERFTRSEPVDGRGRRCDLGLQVTDGVGTQH